MKNALLVLAAALVSSTITALAVTRFAPARAPLAASEPATPEHSPTAVRPDPTSAALDRTSDLAERVDELERLVASLRGELALAMPARTEVTAASPTAEAEIAAALGASGPGAFKTMVLGTLAEEREVRAAAQAERDVEFDHRRAQLRAAAIAEELELPEPEREQVASVLALESDKRRELRNSLDLEFREPGAFDPDAMLDRAEEIRASYDQIRTWKQTELESRLGPETAARVLELDSERRGSRWRGVSQLLRR
jgi:hypothetical protein